MLFHNVIKAKQGRLKAPIRKGPSSGWRPWLCMSSDAQGGLLDLQGGTLHHPEPAEVHSGPLVWERGVESAVKMPFLWWPIVSSLSFYLVIGMN